MIEVKGLVKKYGSKTVLDNVSFEVEEGEIMGLLGPNGAGKSTTMNIITGNLSATDGMVKINGITFGGQKRTGISSGITAIVHGYDSKRIFEFCISA